MLSSLRILDSNLLSNICLANIVSHSVGRLSSFLMISFTGQNLQSDVVPLDFFFFFAFIAFTFGVRAKKLLLGPVSRSLLPMFSSRSFTVSRLTLNSLIHFHFCLWCKIVVQSHSYCPWLSSDLCFQRSFWLLWENKP